MIMTESRKRAGWPNFRAPDGIWRRVARILPLLALAMVPALLFPGLGDGIAKSADAIRDHASRAGVIGGCAAGVAVTAAAVAVGMPRLAMALAAGLAFGAPLGLAVNLCGTLIGSLATFLASRKVAGADRDAVSARHGFSLGRAAAVAAARLAPLPGAASTVAIAAMPCGVAEFLAGSAVGFLPAAGLAAWAGSAI